METANPQTTGNSYFGAITAAWDQDTTSTPRGTRNLNSVYIDHPTYGKPTHTIYLLLVRIQFS